MKNNFITPQRAVFGFIIILIVLLCFSVFEKHNSTYKPITRTYYIAAENVVWDYAPAGKDPYTNEPIPTPYGAQTKYNKVRYIEYTDATFTVKKPQPVWLGILGPIIRGVEGDTIQVVFYNKADKPYSMHPHGLLYDKDNEGSNMPMKTAGNMDSSDSMNSDDMQGAGSEVMPDKNIPTPGR